METIYINLVNFYIRKCDKTPNDINGRGHFTGEELVIENILQDEIHPIITHDYTPFGYVRDCGTHLIKANYSSYTKFIKATGEIIHDVDDC